MINVGLVGYGYWGANLYRAIQESPRLRLAAVCDSRPSAREAAGRRAGAARIVDDLAALIALPDIAAIIVATPVASHFQVALAALEAGKHVLVEKPLARTGEEARELLDAADARDLRLMVGHTFLYNGAVRLVRRMIDAGELGTLRYVFCQRLNLGIVRSDVDALWNLAPHDISILDYWIRRPVVESSAVGNSYLQPGIADVVFAHLKYEGGVAGHIHVSWLDPIKVRRITVVGSKRMLVYDDVSQDARIAIYDKGIDEENMDANLGSSQTYAEHRLKLRAGDVWLPRVDFQEPLAVELEEFASAIEEGRPPLTDGASGLAVVRTLEQLSRSMAAGLPVG